MSFLHRLFKFRIFKFRTNLAEELEDLHSETLHLQTTLVQARLLQTKWTKWFAIYAVLAYLAVNMTYFTLFLSHDNMIRVYAVLTSIAIGALLFGIHWLLRWYFRTLIRMKEDRLELFKDRKQELIEEVKTKETYAKAKELLEKYGEKMAPQPEITAGIANNTNAGVQQRVSIKPPVTTSDKPMVSIPSTNTGTLKPTNTQVPVTVGQNRVAANGPPGKLPRAILPPQRTLWGAILDVIVGDGPSKRYALICKSCHSHNGMALQEEYEYLSFRCAYCNYFNSSRKEKPVFHGDIVARDPQATTTTTTSQPGNESTIEPMEVSSSDSSESIPNDTSGVRHRSIRVNDSENTAESRSRSSSATNRQQNNPKLSSSSEEDLTKNN